MSNSTSMLQRFGVKLFLEPSSTVSAQTCIRTFHRWIQTNAIDGLPIDVADYSHLVEGPHVLLVTQQGNYAVDVAENRSGLIYTQKQPRKEPLMERLMWTCSSVVNAGCLLEQDSTFDPRLIFRGNEIQFVANDRLLAPNTIETAKAVEPILDDLANQLFGGEEYEIVSKLESPDRFTANLIARSFSSLSTLRERMA